jgi:hypothetical protein
MAFMTTPYPTVGDWYRIRGGESFEVVALDEEGGQIEMQYFDGTVEEMELDDWIEQADARVIETAEPPEDWSGSVDMDPLDDDSGDQDRSIDAANAEMLASWDRST